MTAWLRPKTMQEVARIEEDKRVELMEVDAPEMVDTDTIIRKEQAKMKQVQWMMKHDISTIMKELVDGVVARSAVDKVIEEVIYRSQWRVRINQVWRMLEDDCPLQEVVKK